MLFLRLISRLPLSVLYLFSDFLFLLSYHLFRYRRKLVYKNIQNSFPKKTEEEHAIILREFYHNLCDYAVETVKLLTISKTDLAQRVIFTNNHVVEKHKAQNTPIIALASHQFNWEWLLVAGNFYFPLDFVYQPVQNSFFEKVMIACRTRFGGHAIKRNELARNIIKHRDSWRMIAIVSDQYPGHQKDKKYLINFLNQETAFFQGTNQIASLTQYPTVYTAIRKIKRGFYEVEFIPLSEPPYIKDQEPVIDAYAAAAEKVIRENPSGWLWSHNRWKKRHLTQASAKYPPGSTAS